MASPLTAEPPEAAGPGTPDDASGQVLYGADGAPGAPAVFDAPLPPIPGPPARCPRCQYIPDELAASLTAALRPKPGSPR
jgi:hypothetical protein